MPRMSTENYVLHARAIGCSSPSGYTVLQLERGRQFHFSSEQAAWFESLKQPKTKAQILRSFRLAEIPAKRLFAWLVEARLLAGTSGSAVGEPAWCTPDFGEGVVDGGRPIADAGVEQWQSGFAFADATISTVPLCL